MIWDDFLAFEIGNCLGKCANTHSIQCMDLDIYLYICLFFPGKCRKTYDIWMVWDMVSVSGEIKPPNTFDPAGELMIKTF